MKKGFGFLKDVGNATGQAMRCSFKRIGVKDAINDSKLLGKRRGRRP